MNKRRLFNKSLLLIAGFAILNVAMYLIIHRFWIGGSSFLPMIGIAGPDKKFLFAFIVNLGVIAGAAIGAISSGEFRFRLPRAGGIPKAVLGGIMIGIGVTLAPGTCTTCFITGIPMLSVSSFLSAAGIFIGAFIVYRIVWRRS